MTDDRDPWAEMDRLDAERGWPMYFDRQGEPMPMREWVLKMEDTEYRQLAFTRLSGMEVSTVWLGLNHNWFPTGPPLIFETMVFVDLDEPIEVMGRLMHREGTEMWRWATEEQALDGHAQAVASVRVPSSPSEMQREDD